MAEHPDIAELVETEAAVHLVFRLDRDLATDREAAIAEMEQLVSRLQGYVASPAFRQRFGARIGVLRMRTRTQPPSIVAHLMAERGVEIEPEDRPRAEPGLRCALCGRDGLWEDQVTMSDQGWACASCFRAWTIQAEERMPRPLRLPWSRSVTGRIFVVGLVLFLALCAFGAYWTLERMNRINQVIRLHMPTE